jgi:DNA repair protein RecO (recombination protein O)
VNARTQHRTEAIVLRFLNYGESDRIVTFYTAGFGKLKGIAKGAQRSRKRFVNVLEPFCRLELLFSRRGEGLALIESADAACHFANLRNDLEKSMTASCLIDLTDQFTPEETPNEPLYRLLGDFLALLEGGAALPESLLRFFQIRLLGLTGYDPVLDRCLVCNTPLNPAVRYRFTAAAGGLLCGGCRPDAPDALPVSLGTIRTLALGRELPPERLGRLLWSVQSAQESRRLLECFIRHLLGRELKSVEVLNEIRRLSL